MQDNNTKSSMKSNRLDESRQEWKSNRRTYHDGRQIEYNLKTEVNNNNKHGKTQEDV